MATRLELQTLLENICPNVHFQPPPGITMVYPCIIYNRSKIRIDHADNLAYLHLKQYTITVITRDPDSTLPDEISKLKAISFDRHFASDNLYHDVFTLFF